MQSVALIAANLLKMNDYGVEDLVLDSSNPGEGTVSFVKVDSITYPVDTEPICKRMAEDRTSYCILTDEVAIHIFKLDGVSAVEVDSLPPKDLPAAETLDSVRIRSHLSEIIDGLRRVSPHNEIVDDIFTLLSMAIIADENNKWDSLESGSVDVWDSCLNSASGLLAGEHADIDKYRGESARSVYLTFLLRFRDMEVSKPSTILAKAIIDSISNSYRVGYSMISEEMCRLLLSLSSGRTEYEGIGCSMMAVECTESKKKVDLAGLNEPYYGLMSRISGNICGFRPLSDFPGTEYDTIITCPPLIKTSVAETRFISRTSDGIAVESAMSRVADGGRICAMMTPGFLFSKREEKLRNMISERLHISAIIEFERPFRFTAINMSLLILDSEDKGTTVISRKPLQMSDLTTKSIISALNGQMDDIMFMRIEQSSLKQIWTPSAIIADSMITEDAYEGVAISDIAEIIRGCNIPSSKYNPDGSLTGIPYLRISNIKDGMIHMNDAKKVSSQDGKVFSKEGDVVFSIQGTVGKTAIAGERVFIPSGQIALIRHKPGIDPEALISAMDSDYFRKQLAANTTGTVIKGLSVKSLEKMRVVVDDQAVKSSEGGESDDL